MIELQEDAIAQHRNAIARAISPFLELLKDQKHQMDQTRWLSTVRTFMIRIVETPEQYLPRELSGLKESTGMIRSIFHEFIMDNTPFPRTHKP